MPTLDALSAFQNMASTTDQCCKRPPDFRVLGSRSKTTRIGFEVLIAATMKSAIFFIFEARNLYSPGLLFYPEDYGIAFLRKFSELPNYMVLHPKGNILHVYRQ
jgi:hypothetical protein